MVNLLDQKFGGLASAPQHRIDISFISHTALVLPVEVIMALQQIRACHISQQMWKEKFRTSKITEFRYIQSMTCRQDEYFSFQIC